MQAVITKLQPRSTHRRAERARLSETMLDALTRVFGCWHKEMSRPFTLDAKSYRACLECGAHRRFNSQTWEMTGPYFYETPASLAELYRHQVTAVKHISVNRQGRATLRVAA